MSQQESGQERSLVPVTSKKFDRATFVKGLAASLTKSPFQRLVAREVASAAVQAVAKPIMESVAGDTGVPKIRKSELELEEKPWTKEEEREFLLKYIEDPSYLPFREDWPRNIVERAKYMEILMSKQYRMKLLEFYTGEGYRRIPRFQRYQVFRRMATLYKESLIEFRDAFPMEGDPNPSNRLLGSH